MKDPIKPCFTYTTNKIDSDDNMEINVSDFIEFLKNNNII